MPRELQFSIPGKPVNSALCAQGVKSVKGKKKADNLNKQGCASEFVGPDPDVGLSVSPTKMARSKWVHAKHQQKWGNFKGHSRSK